MNHFIILFSLEVNLLNFLYKSVSIVVSTSHKIQSKLETYEETHSPLGKNKEESIMAS